MADMQLQRCRVDVNGVRQLLALVATSSSAPSLSIAASTAAADTTSASSPDDSARPTTAADILPQVDDALVYLHGFPDMSVHPTRLEFASRMPRKLADAWLSSYAAPIRSASSSRTSKSIEDDSTTTTTPPRTAAFVAFNFGGVPGSDNELCFTHKTISKEVRDAVAVCAFVRQRLLRSGKDVTGTNTTGRVHVVGLSTGAIVASLLRNCGVADSIAVIAGLADVADGVAFDFSPAQLAQCERDGACWKEFFIPCDAPLPRGVALSLDGETPIAETLASDASSTSSDANSADPAAAPSRKLFIRLNRAYVDECRSGALDVRHAVSSWPRPLVSETQTHAPRDAEGASFVHSETSQQHTTTMVTTAAVHLPPLLVIHGDADTSVPIQHGEGLFQAASEPKKFVRIARANHLLTNTKHLKRALAAILAHTNAQSPSPSSS